MDNMHPLSSTKHTTNTPQRRILNTLEIRLKEVIKDLAIVVEGDTPAIKKDSHILRATFKVYMGDKLKGYMGIGWHKLSKETKREREIVLTANLTAAESYPKNDCKDVEEDIAYSK